MADIANLYKKLIQEIAPHLNLHILSLGSDGAITEYQAQETVLKIQTSERLSIYEETLNINFSCPIFENVRPVIQIQDLKYAKKTARNAAMSEARLLTFRITSVQFSHFLNLIGHHNSIMYKMI